MVRTPYAILRTERPVLPAVFIVRFTNPDGSFTLEFGFEVEEDSDGKITDEQ